MSHDPLDAVACRHIADVLDGALGEMPGAARSVSTRLRVMRNEYDKAAVYYERALAEVEEGETPMVATAGSLEHGEFILTANGIGKVRRQTPTGVEVMVDGLPQWENISGPGAPMIAVPAPAMEARRARRD